MCAARNLFTNALLSARLVRLRVDASWQTPENAVANFFPNSCFHIRFTSRMSRRLGAGNPMSRNKEENNVVKPVWGSNPSTMSKEEFRKRLDLLIGKSKSSSTSKATESDREKSHSFKSVWGDKAPIMRKAEFGERLGLLHDKPLGSSTFKAAERHTNKRYIWGSEIGELPKTLKKDDFRKRLHLWREGQLPPRGSNIKGRKPQAEQIAEKTTTSDSPLSNKEKIKVRNIDNRERKREDVVPHGLLRRSTRGFFR